jgi:NifB/MoaA-like Fe-S oxidoreductase
MYGFETAYLKWLYENALPDPNERELTQHTNTLIEIMERCRFSIREIDNPCENISTKLPEPYTEPWR